MKGKYKDVLFVAIIALVIVGGVVLADTITTSVRFIVASNVAFSVAVPMNGTFVSSGSTGTIMFNTTLTSSNGINASVVQSGATVFQTSAVAIFLYRNDGNQAINITQLLSANTSCTRVKASNQSTGYFASCNATEFQPPGPTSCTNISTVPALVVANLSQTAPLNNMTTWLWADFSSCSIGLDTTVTLTHNSSASGAS